MSLLLGVLLACSGEEPTPTATADTGGVAVACELEPCVGAVASASWYTEDPGAAVGYDLAADGNVVVAGAPAPFGAPSTDRAVWLEGPALVSMGSWAGFGELTGLSVALADIGADGVVDVFVGRPGYDEGADYGGGRAHLILGPPSGEEADIEDAAVLTVVAGDEPRFDNRGDDVGFDMVVADVGTGAPEWIVDVAHQGELWFFDPTLRGMVGRSDALRLLTGPLRIQAVEAWDGTCDGAKGVVIGTNAGVDWFSGPWNADRHQSDADATWDGSADPGHRLRAEGDVDGDGCDDLLLGLFEHDNRAGAAFVVPAGTPSSARVDELPIQVLGGKDGAALGYSVASGDIDGDGADDLLVGATSLTAGPAGGIVRLYLGPLEGVYAPRDADHMLHADRPGDFLGREMVIVDADGDAQDDVVVSASSAYGGGAVYLIPGADWLGGG